MKHPKGRISIETHAQIRYVWERIGARVGDIRVHGHLEFN
jgi:hypothetical protein